MAQLKDLIVTGPSRLIGQTNIDNLVATGTLNGFTLGKSVPSNAVFTDTTYGAATTSAAGLMSAADKSKLDGITASADTVSFTQTLTSGTKVGTITINGTNTDLYCQTNTNDDTKNTTGTTEKASTKLYLAGAESQGANPQTYSNSKCYIGTDNCLYSNGTKVLTSHDGDTKNTAGADNTTSKIFLVGPTAQTSSNGNARTYSNSGCYASGGHLYSNSKQVISSATAQAGSNINKVGTPTVTASVTNGDATFTFDYLKGATGDKGDTGNSVKELICVTANNGTTAGSASTADSGTSYYRIKDSAGSWLTGTIAVKNGSKGSPGDPGTSVTITSVSQIDNAGGTSTVTFSDGKTLSIKNGTGTVTSVATGTGLTGGPITSTGTISLATSGVTAASYGPSANASPAHSGTFSVPYITVDTYGRITSAATKTITLPASGNTDEKVKCTSATTTKSYLLGVTASSVSSGTAYGANYDTGVYLDTTAGRLTATTMYASSGFFQSSDERLKDFHGSIPVDLDKLGELRKDYFTWKEGENKDVQIGVSAQEIQKIYPEIVSEDSETGKLTVAYDKLSVVALAAIDKLHAENQELKDRLAKLEEMVYGNRS